MTSHSFTITYTDGSSKTVELKKKQPAIIITEAFFLYHYARYMYTVGTEFPSGTCTPSHFSPWPFHLNNFSYTL